MECGDGVTALGPAERAGSGERVAVKPSLTLTKNRPRIVSVKLSVSKPLPACPAGEEACLRAGTTPGLGDTYYTGTFGECYLKVVRRGRSGS